VGGTSYGLSVTRSCNLLVALYDTQQVQEYTPDETLIHQISLNGLHPKHCIQLSRDQFVVCSKDSVEMSLCIVNKIGSIIQAYRGSLGSGIHHPCQMAVDKYGHVIVADYNSNIVEVFVPNWLLSVTYR